MDVRGIFTECGHHTGMRARFALKCLPLLLAAPLWLAPATLTQAQAPGANALPALGDGDELSLSDERRLGDQIARAIFSDPDYLDDPALMAYLQALWQPLLQSAQARGDVPPALAERFAWTLLINRDRAINAFALPGGYLGVNLGLLGAVSSADELASVMAHELSHVSQRHIARLVSRQGRQMPWMVAAMILGAMAASAAKNADIAQAAIVGGQAATLQSQLNFSRDMEREADRVGFGVMTEAGFSGMGFVTMFDKLQQASRLNDDGAFPYLRSHPLTTERIADMRSRLPVHPPHGPDAAGGGMPSAYHALMAARARVLAESHVDRLRVLLQVGQVSGDALLGARYAATLAAARLRDGEAALRGWQQLQAMPVADDAVRQTIHWLRLEVLLELQGTPQARQPEQQQALAALRDEALLQGRRDALVLGARAALLGSAAAQRSAAKKMQEWCALYPRDALVWQTLATLHTALQQPVQAARSEAEARVALLDLQGALDRFRSAQRIAQQYRDTDHVEMSILDARVRQVEAQLNEQWREEYGPQG